jgi:hypothetical protein
MLDSDDTLSLKIYQGSLSPSFTIIHRVQYPSWSSRLLTVHSLNLNFFVLHFLFRGLFSLHIPYNFSLLNSITIDMFWKKALGFGLLAAVCNAAPLDLSLRGLEDLQNATALVSKRAFQDPTEDGFFYRGDS